MLAQTAAAQEETCVQNGGRIGRSTEWVKIDFTLQGGQGIDDVVAELTNGDLRIGIHVIAFDSGGSESFINVPIPEPGTALLVATGLLALAASRRR